MRVCVYPPYVTWPFYIMQHNYPFVESLIKALSMPRWSELHILTFPPVYIIDGVHGHSSSRIKVFWFVKERELLPINLWKKLVLGPENTEFDKLFFLPRHTELRYKFSIRSRHWKKIVQLCNAWRRTKMFFN